jgi:hypothetical protein
MQGNDVDLYVRADSQRSSSTDDGRYRRDVCSRRYTAVAAIFRSAALPHNVGSARRPNWSRARPADARTLSCPGFAWNEPSRRAFSTPSPISPSSERRQSHHNCPPVDARRINRQHEDEQYSVILSGIDTDIASGTITLTDQHGHAAIDLTVWRKNAAASGLTEDPAPFAIATMVSLRVIVWQLKTGSLTASCRRLQWRPS